MLRIIISIYCRCDQYFLECDWPKSDTVRWLKAATSSIAKLEKVMISQSRQEETKTRNERVALAA
jgi:hypothetical protein